MIRKKRSLGWPFITWSLLAALFFIFLNGYTFNSGDQEEHLPYLYRLINPSLYSLDYLVPYQTSHFTVRFYFVWMLFGLSKIFPVEWIVFVLHLISLAVVSWGVGVLTVTVTGRKESFLLAAFSVLLVLNNVTVGGNSIMDVQLTCSSLATALCVISIYLVFQKNIISAAIIAGIAALFQVLIGVHVILLISVISFLNADHDKLKDGLYVFFTGILCASPMLIPILLSQSKPIDGDAQLYYSVLYNYRNPHHYLPSHFPISDYIKTGFLWLIALICCTLDKSKFNKIYIYLIGIVILGGVMYTILMTNENFMGIGKLQWFKTTIWITLLSVIPIVGFLMGFAPVRNFAQKINRISIPVRGTGILFLLIVVVNTGWIPLEKLNKRYQVGFYKKDDKMLMHEWIAANTPLDAVILAEPDDDGFLCQAKRSTPVAYKGIVHEPAFLIPWYNKMVDVYGVGINQIGRNPDVVSSAVILYPQRTDSMIISSITIDYRIWNLAKTSSSVLVGKKVIHQEGSYILTLFEK
ncbi:hypothetical protein BH11BAC2_BH11BAC2_07940 [soil metagenome]